MSTPTLDTLNELTEHLDDLEDCAKDALDALHRALGLEPQEPTATCTSGPNVTYSGGRWYAEAGLYYVNFEPADDVKLDFTASSPESPEDAITSLIGGLAEVTRRLARKSPPQVFLVVQGEDYIGSDVDSAHTSLESAREAARLLIERENVRFGSESPHYEQTTPEAWRRGPDYVEVRTIPLQEVP